jgi:hypothetical protein
MFIGFSARLLEHSRVVVPQPYSELSGVAQTISVITVTKPVFFDDPDSKRGMGISLWA